MRRSTAPDLIRSGASGTWQCRSLATRPERCAAPGCARPAAHRVTITGDGGDRVAQFFLCDDDLDAVFAALDLIEAVLKSKRGYRAIRVPE